MIRNVLSWAADLLNENEMKHKQRLILRHKKSSFSCNTVKTPYKSLGFLVLTLPNSFLTDA